jgi:hypothetical protein
MPQGAERAKPEKRKYFARQEEADKVARNSER